jgi:hypothetical protein
MSGSWILLVLPSVAQVSSFAFFIGSTVCFFAGIFTGACNSGGGGGGYNGWEEGNGIGSQQGDHKPCYCRGFGEHPFFYVCAPY